MTNWSLFHGDCLEVMSTLPSASVDAIIADPPYGTTRCKWDAVIPLEPMWEQLKRIIKPRGVIVLMAQTPFDKVLGASNISQLKYEWIWEKTNATGFLNAKKMPLKAHENALVFSDDPEEHWNMLVFYNRLPTYNPRKTEGHPRKSAVRGSVNSEVYGRAIKNAWYDSTSRYPRSVQRFKKDKQTCAIHPTQKPVALMEYLIRTYTDPGEVVMDFCMGSGSTGVACANAGRQFVGIEKVRDYFDVAKDRIEIAYLGL